MLFNSSIPTSLHISQYTVWAALAFLAGTALMPPMAIMVALVILLAYYGRHAVRLSSRWGLIIIIVVSFWSGHYWYHQHVPAEAAQLPFEHTVEFTGTISRPPIVKGTAQKLHVATTEFPGKIYIKTGRYPEYHYGDSITVTCVLTQPEPFETFAFDKYLARYTIFSLCRQARVYRLEERTGHPILHTIYDIREWFVMEIRRLWPEPVASLMLGVILGIQDDIPPDIVEQFRVTGTIHVLVVSGMHVVIIAQLLTKTLQVSLSARQRLVVIGAVLVAFCIITGLQASVVRAAIMGMVPLVAEVLHRKATIHNSLALIAAVMAIINPYVVLHDMGFQLSFLATIGLVYFQPICDNACWWVPRQFTLRETLSTTIAATIPTTPLILATFGTFSVVSLLANIIVVPVSNIMLFGGTAIIIVQQVMPQLAMYGAFLLHTAVQAMLWVITWLSNVPNALLEQVVLPRELMIGMYVLMALYILRQIKQTNHTL